MIYIFAVVVLFLISTIPTKKNKKMEWMKGYSFHRGKFCEDQSIPENSIAAIVEAIKMKADIEIDIRITADNVLVVFHDESLHRMCNVDGLIENMTYDAIQEYSLKETKEHIPTFEQVLHVVDGQINLIIEIKPTSRVDQVCTLVMEHLFDYQGNYAICSFHPMIVTYFKKYFPDVIRGQIIKNFLNDKQHKLITRVLLTINGFNFYTRSDFISVHYSIVLYFVWMKLFHSMICTWAISDAYIVSKLIKKVDHLIIEFVNYD